MNVYQQKTAGIRWMFLIGLVLVGSTWCNAQTLLRKQVLLMGSRFEITLVEKDSLLVKTRADQVVAEIKRIENLISEWRPETQISEVNRNAGKKPVKVSREVFELTSRAIAYAKLSQGAFDISVASMDNLWKFDGSMTKMPAEEVIKQSVARVGYQHIVLDSAHCTIYLALPGMKISFGSIGKGYAADKGRELMQSLGVQGGIINASGDLSAWGAPPAEKAWKIGINHPFKQHKILKTFNINEASVVTSGSYEKYAEISGQRFSHIINPKTGYPATGLTSVTIMGPSAEFANALSTSVMVLGEQEGIDLLKQYPQYSYVLVKDDGRLVSSRR